mmetsp:Transcript_14427/g.30691  ORF Transcript_14427/g.30691 Transcript_14427/m.30691 type:complete len:284 (+) Transcript_14427:258-1109(+)
MILVASNPSITGMRRSIKMRLYIFGAGADRNISMATSPFSALCDVQFNFRKCIQSNEALTSVSSTTSTRGRAPGATPGYRFVVAGGLAAGITPGGGLVPAAGALWMDVALDRLGAAAAEATSAPVAPPNTFALRMLFRGFMAATATEGGCSCGGCCKELLARFCRCCDRCCGGCIAFPIPPSLSEMVNDDNNGGRLAAVLFGRDTANAVEEDGSCCCCGSFWTCGCGCGCCFCASSLTICSAGNRSGKSRLMGNKNQNLVIVGTTTAPLEGGRSAGNDSVTIS